MKIACWNIARFNQSRDKKHSIIECLKTIDADILILTETDENIALSEDYCCYHSSRLSDSFYREGERRVSIYSKYNILEYFRTFRDDTSICVKLKTTLGDLVVYGTIIGIFGNRTEHFNKDLDQQLIDFDKFGKTNNFCICGDLNMTFSDNYYYTKNGRQKLNKSFDKLNLINTTAGISENIDHIILTKSFIENRPILTQTWNMDKKLSDHIGVSVDII